jgi:hypothetical protein
MNKAYKCTINTVGINSNDGRVHFRLTELNNTFTYFPYIAKQEQSREILAIALAAMTSSTPVVIQVDVKDVDPMHEWGDDWQEVWWFDIEK